MATNNAELQAVVAEEIIFNSDDSVDAVIQINPNMAHNFVNIVSLDGLDGSPVVPASGEYNIFVETMPDGGFQGLKDGGVISAVNTGGTAGVDGDQVISSFEGNPIRIKIVPDSIVGAVAYRVYIKQNAT